MMWIFLILSSLCQNFGSAENCDFVKCTMQVKDFIFQLQSDDGKFSCKSFYKSINPCCSELHIKKNFPSSIPLSSENTFMDCCESSLSQYPNVNWSCISKHSFRILTCIANVSSLKINDSRGNMLFKQSCRKRLEYQNCPEVLNKCGLQSVKFVKDILEFVINYLKIPSCVEAEVSSIPVIYHLHQEHMMIAQCYDKYATLLNICFQQLIQDDSDLYEYICGDYNDINKCIEFQFSKYSHNYCKSSANVSYELLKDLLTLGSVKCKSSLLLQHLTPQTFNDLEDESTENISQEKYSNSNILTDQDSINLNFKTSTVTLVSEIMSSSDLSKEIKEGIFLHRHAEAKQTDKNSSTINLLKTKNSLPHFKTSIASILNYNKALLINLIFVVLSQKFLDILY